MTAAASPTPARPSSDGRDDSAGEPTEDPSSADVDEDTTAIRVATEGTTVVIAVARCLDVPTGEALLSAATAAVATRPSRLDIDLRELENYTPEGAGALASCRALASELTEGLHYRTGRGPGRDALLAAYTTAEMEAIKDV
jgi:hypothetical protein